MSQSVAEITKEIIIAMVEKGHFVFSTPSAQDNDERRSERNKTRTEEVGKAYNHIYNAVSNSISGNFDDA